MATQNKTVIYLSELINSKGLVKRRRRSILALGLLLCGAGRQFLRVFFLYLIIQTVPFPDKLTSISLDMYGRPRLAYAVLCGIKVLMPSMRLSLKLFHNPSVSVSGGKLIMLSPLVLMNFVSPSQSAFL